jgi:hypothetical protein
MAVLVEETGETLFSDDVIWHNDWPRHGLKGTKETYDDIFILDEFEDDMTTSSQTYTEINTEASTLENEAVFSPYQPEEEELDSEDERQEERYSDLFHANNAEWYEIPSADRILALMVVSQQMESNPNVPKSFKEAMSFTHAPQWKRK